MLDDLIKDNLAGIKKAGSSVKQQVRAMAVAQGFKQAWLQSYIVLQK